MPFKSKAQRRWMYANDKEMADRWSKDTPKGKKLPEKVKKQAGGPYVQDNAYYTPGDENYVPKIDMSMYAAPDPGADINLNDVPYSQRAELAERQRKIPRTEKERKEWNPTSLLRNAGIGASLLSGRMERNRQDQYMYDQFSSMGQLNPMPVDNFQPNPYRLYSQYGGSIKKYQQGGPTIADATNHAKAFALRRGHMNPQEVHTGNVLPQVIKDGVQVPYGQGPNQAVGSFNPIPLSATSTEFDATSRRAYWRNEMDDLVEMDPRDMNRKQFLRTTPPPALNSIAAKFRKGGKFRGK